MVSSWVVVSKLPIYFSQLISCWGVGNGSVVGDLFYCGQDFALKTIISSIRTVDFTKSEFAVYRMVVVMDLTD